MKRILTIIFLILFCNLSIAQHTNRFLELVKDLKVIETKNDTLFYRNGKIWWKTTWTTYEYNSETHSTRTGELIQYYKNGQTASEFLLDDYGNILSRSGFDRKGNKTSETITTEVDSNAKNMDEFFESEEHMIYRGKIKYYKCSYKLGICYLFREGQSLNGKKIGLWKTYTENGNLKREKTY